jgi:ribosomal protein S18 acetylase RimI-like enzyme
MDSKIVVEIINDLRRSKSCINNAYFTGQQLLDLLQKDTVTTYHEDGLLAIIETEDQLVRLYFYAGDSEKLSLLNNVSPNSEKPIVVDIIGKHEKITEMVSIIEERTSLFLYNTYLRMICKEPVFKELKGDSSIVEYADPDDATDIYNIYTSTFDILTDHFPSFEVFQDAIGRKEIIVARLDNRIVGFHHYKNHSEKYLELKAEVISPEYRGQHLDSALWKFINEHCNNGTIFMLWHYESNKIADYLHQRYGFRYDGIVDYILVRKG